MKNIFIIFIFSFFANQANAQYYATPKGNCYHRGDCVLVERTSHEVISENEAEKRGLKSCERCNPAERGPGYGGRIDDKKGKCEPAVQCSGITKKGTKCKHMTTICGGYCYEHGNN